MLAQASLLPSAISELFAHASRSGSIRLADRYGLMAALLDDSINEEERFSIDRFLHVICQGRLKVMKELSVVL